MTFSPTICIDFSGWGTVLAVGFLCFVAGHWLGHLKAVRENEAAVRRMTGQQLSAPWYAPGPPVVVHRVDAEQTIFKRRAFREDPSWDYREAA